MDFKFASSLLGPLFRSSHRSQFHQIFKLLLISYTFATVLADSMSAPETEMRKSVSDLEACDLRDTPMYCYCNPSDPLEVEELKCQAWGSPTIENDPWGALGALKNITYFEFSNRPERALTYFPPRQLFQDFSKLRYFNIKLSQFEEIPSFAFSNSTSLSDITLMDNVIVYLRPNSFANMKNLSKLNVGMNMITEINREVFVNLPKLQYLYLDQNRIQVIHDYAFKGLGNVEELALQKNNLTVIAREVFSGMGKVRLLELQSNMIEFLGDHVFADMPFLRELDLHGNQIRSVSPTAFYGLKDLQRLIMKGNKIVMLKPPTFIHFNNIYMLDLRDNELDTLSEDLIEPIYTNLKNVSMQLMMEGNRLTCDCRILWIQKLYKETESDHVKRHLAKTQCDLFHTSEQKMRELNHGMAVSYSSNVTVVAAPPEETTTYAFDSIKNVIELNPADFKCHDHHNQQQPHKDESNNFDAGYPASQDDSQASYNDDEGITQKSKVVYGNDKHDKEVNQQSHHQSRTDTSYQSDDKSAGVGTDHSSDGSLSGGSSSRNNNYSHYLTSWISLLCTGFFYSLTFSRIC